MKIVRIGDGSSEPATADIIGAKAANIARMAALGLPVPPAFVLPIELCAAIVAGDAKARAQLAEGLADGIAHLEKVTGRRFGGRRNPLLVSVRSGAARSMPGMLDTVLNVGSSMAAVHGLVRSSGNPRFAWDCRRRFLESFGEVVLDVDRELFARRIAQIAAGEKCRDEAMLDGEAMERLALAQQQVIEERGEFVCDEPMDQLEMAAGAVYRSWMSDRARTYRKLQGLDDLRGTAVTVQAMVFGNAGRESGAGVAFSRDPSTGAAQPVIEVLFGAQGEDVVSGNRTPANEQAIEQRLPTVATQLREVLHRLEREFADIQDIEFTIEAGRLWLLQTRPAKRTPAAALRFAVELVREGVISPARALQLLDGIDVSKVCRARLRDVGDPAAHGIGASAGVAVGRVAFSSESAERIASSGDPVILVRRDTSTADVAGFAASAGIVTAIGGRTAHAALVARQMGKPSIVGCAALQVDPLAQTVELAGQPIREGDWLSIDGEAGTIFRGRGRIETERLDAFQNEIESWRRQVA